MNPKSAMQNTSRGEFFCIALVAFIAEVSQRCHDSICCFAIPKLDLPAPACWASYNLFSFAPQVIRDTQLIRAMSDGDWSFGIFPDRQITITHGTNQLCVM